MRMKIADTIRTGEYKNVIEMTIWTCDHRHIELPLDDYVESIDGDLEEYCADWMKHEYIDEYDKTEVIDNNLVLLTLPDCECSNCRNGKMYVKDLPKPQGDFSTVTKKHGLIAYMRSDMQQAKEHLAKLLSNKEYETCCSTMALGNVGVVLQGEVICVSNEDLYSQVDQSGRYVYMKEVADYLVYNIEDMEFPTDLNDELITKDHTLVSIWYKEHSSNSEKEFARELAEFYNVPLYEEPMTQEDKRLLEQYEDEEDWLF